MEWITGLGGGGGGGHSLAPPFLRLCSVLLSFQGEYKQWMEWMDTGLTYELKFDHNNSFFTLNKMNFNLLGKEPIGKDVKLLTVI